MTDTGRAALSRLLAEAQRTADFQVRLAEALDEKAARLLRFDAALIGILVAGVTVWLGDQQEGTLGSGTFVALVGGLGAIVVSLATTVLAARTKELRQGLQAEMLVGAVAFRPSEVAILQAAIVAYGEGILDNAQALERATHRVEVALWALLFGVMLLAAGTMALLVANAPW